MYICIYIYIDIYLSVYLSTYLSIYLSIDLSTKRLYTEICDLRKESVLILCIPFANHIPTSCQRLASAVTNHERSVSIFLKHFR